MGHPQGHRSINGELFHFCDPDPQGHAVLQHKLIYSVALKLISPKVRFYGRYLVLFTGLPAEVRLTTLT